MRRKKQPGSPSPESSVSTPPLKIPYEPASLKELTRRAKRVEEIVAAIETAKKIPSWLWFKQFDI
jgi:hypothetical protein